eukprot:CAMPEP_0197492530 /NCGR_PEP_ID=MMETSP1311-20131121/10383_1 /TAXON_ID=464262 /ORGANISM="Genus nov. species nov., Strain RCC856" /LENGTH=145 /DNA_ID=CAMNT_0043037483 /DNA_START=89 /DNA_END=526 /DNA_ORIENTATION=+
MAARIIAQLIVSGGTILFRSAAQAYRQAIINGKKAGVHEGTATAFSRAKKMDLSEAYDILGVAADTPWPEVVKKFDHLYGVNERMGSFYLQSKIYRAKERLELELPEDVREQMKQQELQMKQQQEKEDSAAAADGQDEPKKRDEA